MTVSASADVAVAILRATPKGIRVKLEFEGDSQDLLRILEAAGPKGPENLSTREASERYGWRSKDWARWADEGRIDGAIRERKKWRLPNLACKAIADENMKRPNPHRQPKNNPKLQHRRGGNHGRFHSKKTASAQAA